MALNEITDFYQKHNEKVKVDQRIVDTAINLGMYGKTPVQRRFCVYFCSCATILSNVLINDIRNRFMMLASDTERVVRLELSFHIRYFIKEAEETYIKKNLLKIVYLALKAYLVGNLYER